MASLRGVQVTPSWLPVATTVLLVVGVAIDVHTLQTQPMPTPVGVFTFLALLACLPMMLCGTVVGFFLMVSGRVSPLGRAIVGTAALWILGSLIAFGAEQSIREAAILHQATAAQPIVEAVRRYERAHGRAPLALGDLVPSQLATVPVSGLARAEYRYQAGEDGAWSLRLHLPEAGLGMSEELRCPPLPLSPPDVKPLTADCVLVTAH